jgi:outer membrane biogenesis lipoprotein LolB
MSGRISVRQGDRSDIAKLRWTHKRDADVWAIASPLGNEVARIESNAGGAVLSTGGQAQAADSFDDLTEKILGVPLNPRMLAAWLHGDLHETPAQWRVTIDETQKAGNVELARRLSAVRGETSVRLVVDEYQPLQE